MASPDDMFDALPTDPVKHFKPRMAQSAARLREIWENAEENEDFVRAADDDSGQWPEDDYNSRKERGLPLLQINDTILAVNAISGREMTSRFEPTYLGQDETFNDQGFANVCRQFSRKVREASDFEHVDSDAFRSLHIQNYAWTEWMQDLSEEPFGIGRTRLKYVPLYEMAWDMHASETNLADMIWNARGRWVGFDVCVGMFPDAADQSELKALRDAGESSWVDSAFDGGWPYGDEDSGDSPWVWKQARAVFVVDYAWREQRIHYIVDLSDPSDPASPARYDEIESTDELDETRKIYKAAYRSELPFSPVPRWVHKYAYIVGPKAVQSRDSAIPSFHRQCMTSFPQRRRDGVKHYSTVDLMKDGQRFRNMVFAMAISLFQNSAKQPLMVEELALTDASQANNYNKIGGVVKFREGKIGAFKEGQAPTWPPAFEQMLQHATDAVWRPVGLTPAALGQINDPRRVSGTVFNRMQEAVEAVLSFPFDALRMYRKQQARTMLDFMEAHYDEETVARMVGGVTEQQAAQMDPQVILQEGLLVVPAKSRWRELRTFDILIDESSREKSQMHETFSTWTEQGLATSLMSHEPPLMPVDLLPDMAVGLSEPMRQRWKAYLKQVFPSGIPAPPPAAPPEETEPTQ